MSIKYLSELNANQFSCFTSYYLKFATNQDFLLGKLLNNLLNNILNTPLIFVINALFLFLICYVGIRN